MNSVLNVEVVGEALLKETFCRRSTTAKSGRLPAVESTRSFNLEDLRSFVLIDAAGDKAEAERSDTARLSVLLEQLGNLLAQHEGRDVLEVACVVDLSILASLQKHLAEVGTDARVGHAHLSVDSLHLVDSRRVDQRGHELFLACDDDAVLRSDSEASLAVFNRLESVCDLSKLSALAESRE